MSIYISGVDLPKDSEHILSITINHDGTVYRNLDLKCKTIATAISVPPHGRLIDADALRQSLGESIDECNKWADEVEGGEMYARVSQSLGTFVECSLRVKAAPTIIEAEEGE